MNKGKPNPNAGRKKGSKNKSTIAKEIALEDFKELGRKHAKELFAIQLELAQGLQILHWKTFAKKDKKFGYYESTTFDKEIIKRYLDGEYTNSSTIYWLETKEPNNAALDSILNRTFGKPTEVVEMQGADGGNFWEGFMAAKKTNVLAKE